VGVCGLHGGAERAAGSETAEHYDAMKVLEEGTTKREYISVLGVEDSCL
jgi:hypothetical protein